MRDLKGAPSKALNHDSERSGAKGSSGHGVCEESPDRNVKGTTAGSWRWRERHDIPQTQATTEAQIEAPSA
jgi:hypothetical protein